jgi:arsenite/tail-anchored protein-transporting ATPase
MLSPHLHLASRWIFVAGKGGVGKTTTAGALAVELADAGEKILVLSVDPAHSLGDALGAEVGAEPVQVSGVPGLSALEVDAEAEQRTFLAAHGAELSALIERGTYLDAGDVEEFTRLGLPGTDELAALLRLIQLGDRPGGRTIIDTAPTGHTLRLLDMPRVAFTWLQALEAMEAKHAAVASAFSGGSAPHDEVTTFLSNLRGDLERVNALLRDPDRSRVLLVTSAEPAVLAETRRYQEKLTEMGLGLAGIVVNRRSGEKGAAAAGPGVVFVPELAHAPTGIAGLRAFSGAAVPLPAEPTAPEDTSHAAGFQSVAPFHPPRDRGLYLVAGKGGVGKSTVAASLALWLSSQPRGTLLLLSVDPAGSLGDLLGSEVSARPEAVPGFPSLHAQQLDASSAWSRFRESYRAEVAALFQTVISGSTSMTHDRNVVQRLLDMAPPGIDELMALMEVIDAHEVHSYDGVVLDTAPTGHLLRLLQMPALALEWTHSLLRLLLKYREVVRLGEVAERLLSLSRQLRSFREGLADPARTWCLVVALPEALSVPETRRLCEGLRRVGVEPAGILVNRAADRPGQVRSGEVAVHLSALASAEPAVPLAVAPLMPAGPSGPEQLLEFATHWSEIRAVTAGEGAVDP